MKRAERSALYRLATRREFFLAAAGGVYILFDVMYGGPLSALVKSHYPKPSGGEQTATTTQNTETTLTHMIETQTTATKSHLIGREYGDKNLKGWEVIVGDAIYAASGESPVNDSDIETLHFDDYSELRANIKKRRIMAHNITFLKKFDDDAFKFRHTLEYQFRLPYMPSKSESELNPQTIEGHIALWDGSGIHEAPKTRYVVGWEWVLNPWDTEYSDLRIWLNEKWIKVTSMQVNTFWHTIKMHLDVRSDAGYVIFDSDKHLVRSISKVIIPSWGLEIAAWVAGEAISIYPGERGNGAIHKAHFKDWKWIWEPY